MEHGAPHTEGRCAFIVISDDAPILLSSLLGSAWAAVRSLVAGPRKPN